ncbi:hypothetical protein CTI14_68590, partial [Methylobacterium radiotolerans]
RAGPAYVPRARGRPPEAPTIEEPPRMRPTTTRIVGISGRIFGRIGARAGPAYVPRARGRPPEAPTIEEPPRMRPTTTRI